MKTSLIDSSLVGLSFHIDTRKRDVFLYCSALREAGADFVEVDLQALTHLPRPNGSERYIFRLNSEHEIPLANALPFSYVSVPLRLSHMIPRLTRPILLDVHIGSANPIALAKVVAENIDLTRVALLRLTGDFDGHQNTDDLAYLINAYRSRYAVPIDICPTDQSLCAMSAATSAFFARADTITLRFGGQGYAALEDFLIALATMHRVLLRSTYVIGISKATIFASTFSDIENTNLRALMKIYRLAPKDIRIVDDEKTGLENLGRKLGGGERHYVSVIEKRLGDLEVDDELTAVMMNALNRCLVRHDVTTNNEQQTSPSKSIKDHNETRLLM